MMMRDPRELFQAELAVYARDIYVYFRRLGLDASAAEDLRQETLLRAWQGLPRLRQVERMRSWLYGIAYRVYLTHRQRPAEAADETAEGLPAAHGDPGSDQSLGAQVVRQAVLHLPAKYRHPLVLRYWQDLSYQEAAAALGIPVGTFAWRVHVGLRLTRQALSGKGFGDADLHEEATADGSTDSVGKG
jgi:RNA polymerase sigma-70 factor, ECF subfamily